MRMRKYVEKGEAEGNTILDAMRDGTTDGMRFDGENRKADSVVEFETGMPYANAGNQQLELADFLRAAGTPSAGSSRSAEIETER